MHREWVYDTRTPQVTCPLLEPINRLEAEGRSRKRPCACGQPERLLAVEGLERSARLTGSALKAAGGRAAGGAGGHDSRREFGPNSTRGNRQTQQKQQQGHGNEAAASRQTAGSREVAPPSEVARGNKRSSQVHSDEAAAAKLSGGARGKRQPQKGRTRAPASSPQPANMSAYKQQPSPLKWLAAAGVSSSFCVEGPD